MREAPRHDRGPLQSGKKNPVIFRGAPLRVVALGLALPAALKVGGRHGKMILRRWAERRSAVENRSVAIRRMRLKNLDS